MDSFKVDTGEKRISINGDESRVIVFNPSDVVFAERFYALMDEFKIKLTEYKSRSEQMDLVIAVDPNGLPVNLGERLALLHEACDYLRERVDHLFGEGTSQKVFGDARTLDMFKQFFEGITPLLRAARSAKVEQYTNKKEKRVKK